MSRSVIQRDLRALADRRHDLVVVGGGIHGATLAREAAVRGLAVCLLEKSDFASGTSANTMKIIHGGLRYLQHGDLRRVRASIRERRTLLGLAPHLLRPLPVLLPTYGHGWQGRAMLRAALVVNDLIGLDRNVGLAAGLRIPRGRMISKQECLQLLPELPADEVTGGAIFHDAQVYNAERLLLAFLHSAAGGGAALANYVEVTGFLRRRDRVLGVEALDRLHGERLEIQGQVVVNATGPWAERVLQLAEPRARLGVSYARALNVVTRQLVPTHAVGLPSSEGYRDRDVLVPRRTRLLFIVPWRRRSIIGTWYSRYPAGAETPAATEDDIVEALADINRTYPAFKLTLDDVLLVHTGLVPASGFDPLTGDPQLAKTGWIVDHTPDGLPGLVSVVGVKYTTARLTAERLLDRLVGRVGRARRPLAGSGPETGPEGGVAPPSGAFGLSADALDGLVRNYGAAAGAVLEHLGPERDGDETARVLRAEVRHAIRCEMAQTLADVVFRRTELGTAGDPGRGLIATAARTAGEELGWTGRRTRDEVAQVYGRFGVPR